ncbi:WD repeat-containing protein [Reticulomyxa filosa]|uniref:WD repeat-containing protein n=1 Tax=Reticulomyxa filosa TaxID=46433 RepID=X6LXP3_RETFI|nr:WD repeat-containing protein [Reticulomyxa filosa]|eukprot:ETO05897.1 WD repeat-containing protein [Reticulomyxa filosa]
MSNQNSTQKPTLIQNLKDLPTQLSRPQCVLHKHEILVCGGAYKRECYSYHTIKNEYKFICEYPNNVILSGHCVVKLIDNNNKDNNEIILLSFGGNQFISRHTLVMKYISVWSDDSSENEMNKSTKLKNYNQWIPFTGNHNNSINIGNDNDNYSGVRAVIGGKNNNLLFITSYYNNISVFDLNIFKFIKHDKLPCVVMYHCFVLKQEKQNNNKMILFYKKTGLSIKYNEDHNSFQFNKLSVCKNFESLYDYSYVCINDIILFFGGYSLKGNKHIISKAVYKYSIQSNTWTTFEFTLPIILYNSFGILNEDNTYIHIIGGSDDKENAALTHVKTKVCTWDPINLSKNEVKIIIEHWIRILTIKLGWINDFNKIIIKYVSGFQLLMVLQAHNTVKSVSFSADNRNIVSASYDNTVRIWDVISGKQLQVLRGHTDRVFTAKFSPDGHNVVSCSKDGTIRLWDINTETEIMKFGGYFDKIFDVNFSPNGKYIVSGLQDNIIRLWDVHSGIEIKQLLGHSKSVLSTQFSPDGKMIVSSSIDKTINIWDVKSGEILKQFKRYSDSIANVKFSPDGKFIIFCLSDNTIQIWNIETGIEWKILKGHTSHVNDVKYFPDGETILSCSSDNTIQLWNVKSGKRIQMLEGHSQTVKSVDVSPNGNAIVSGSTDCTIRIWG